jgi:hypothetical protein
MYVTASTNSGGNSQIHAYLLFSGETLKLSAIVSV